MLLGSDRGLNWKQLVPSTLFQTPQNPTSILKCCIYSPQDVSFWLPTEGFTENNLCEIVRGIAGNLVEEVKLIDDFTNKKTGKTSNCYRITYRSMERSLTDEEINELQTSVRGYVGTLLITMLNNNALIWAYMAECWLGLVECMG